MDRVVESLVDRGCIVEPEAAEHIRRQSDPDAYLRSVLSSFLEIPFHLTLSQLLESEALLRERFPAPVSLPDPPRSVLRELPAISSLPIGNVNAADYAAEVEVLLDSSQATAPVGELNDFVHYFNDRYDWLNRMLRRRRELAHAVPLARALQSGPEVPLVGLVTEVSKSSKNGHRFVEMEDNTSSVTVLVHASRPDLVAMADSLLNDEVIGVVAKISKDGALLVADQILRPDLPMRAESRAPLEVPLHAAFLGDIHIGSKTFLEPAFKRMVNWLRAEEGPERERALARQIKYLVLPGDIVDGVGVYPGQEESLIVHDILQQYRLLAQALERLPRHLHLVVLPGNHDASRPTEPQPAFSKEIRGFFDFFDTTFVSNPSTFALHGRRVLAYHGFSMIDFATRVPGLSLERPTEIMRQMLQCRHLAPAYGAKTPIAPQQRDDLVIRLEPDIFATGHVHVADRARYNGITLVNGGTWQAQTSYQKMLNLTPTPAVLPLINLSTLAATKVDFFSEA